MHATTVYVFGNPDIAVDATPVELLPFLRERFLDVEFLFLDPNDEWEIPDPLIIIDTVMGIKDIHIFYGLDEFVKTPSVSVHDFDALSQLRLLKKLGKLGQVIIIGVSPLLPMKEAGAAITGALSALLPQS
jgi:Ni,Fe-hydrogenase maturation factor